MPLSYLEESGFAAGMVRDEPSWLLPRGAVYDSLNMLYDKQGIARMRMGSTALVSGSQTAFATSLGWCYSRDAATADIEQLYGWNGKTGEIFSINSSNGSATSAVAAFAGNTVTAGRSCQHYGFVVFPGYELTAGSRRTILLAGQTSVSTFASATAAVLTAGTPTIALGGADVTTNMRVGAAVSAIGAANAYFGRVTAITDATHFKVWPVPSATFNTTALGLNVRASSQGGVESGLCATSFQNRLLTGNVLDPGSLSVEVVADRRVMYSPLITETYTHASNTALTVNGAGFMAPGSWPVLNYFDVPGADPIVAMEPISEGELVILTPRDLIIFNGNLTTQTSTTSPTITFDVYPLGTTYGCLSDLSVHRTPVGIMWAGIEGVFAYWPPIRRNPAKTGIRNLMDNKILTYWQSLVTGSNFAIHGSVYVRNYYIISGTSGGSTFSLACDLRSDSWTRLSGVGTDLFYGVARPTDKSQVFALRWWDQTGAAPSMTNGQTLRLESMMAPYVAGATTTDADGTAVSASITTRTITGDPETQKIFQRATVRHQQSSTTAAMTVTAQSKIDAADISAASVRTLGSLSNTSVLTVSNATNANPIVVTTSANHGLQTDDFVDIDGVTGNTNANGRWRISVTGATTFSLVGGIGNGAFGGSPTCKKLTETDYLASTLNAGQGASVTISGSPNNFELHGIRLGVFEKQPVMSA